MAQFGNFQAACAGFYRLFRREVLIRRNQIRQGMLFDLLPVDFGGPRPGRIPADIIFHRLFFTHAFPIPVFFTASFAGKRVFSLSKYERPPGTVSFEAKNEEGEQAKALN